MDNVRKNQIAFLFLKQQLRERGVRITPNFRREIGNISKSIGVPNKEAMEFAEIIVRELVEEMFRD